jgi:uncharacterized protein with PQ loop repeat
MNLQDFDTKLEKTVDNVATVLMFVLLIVLYLASIYGAAMALYNVHTGFPVYYPLVTCVVTGLSAVGLTYYMSYFYALRSLARGG